MKRYEELDSMRGIAALIVVISHLILALGSLPNYIDYSPMYLFWAGHEAVIFFFILSGFVLSLPFYNGKKRSYLEFITKRIIRIYLPFLISLAFTFFMYKLLYKGGMNDASEWLIQKWDEPLSLKMILEHALLIGNFSTGEINPVIWTLTQEMRISLIFPFIILLILRCKTITIFVLGILLSSLTGINYVMGVEESLGYKTSFFDTLNFISMFMIGAMLAKNKDKLINMYIHLNVKLRVALLIVGILFYIYSRGIRIIPTKFMIIVADWGIAIGVSIFIVTALSSSKFSKLLLNKILVFNGKLSFSLYLYHVVVLITTIHLLENFLPLLLIIIISVPIMYLISYISWRFIEEPSIKLGRKVNFSKRNSVKEKSKVS